MWKYIAGWFGLLLVAMINGAIRDVLYKPYVGELFAHQLSTVIGIILFAFVIRYYTMIWPLASSRQSWLIGFIWLAMTISFEFLFFHYASGVPWEFLLHDYNIFEGRLWVLVLVWTTIAPRVMWRRNGR